MSIRFAFPFAARVAVAVGAAVLAVGCASIPSSPEEAVKARANERWQLMIKNDFQKAYEYTTPAYKAIHPADKYFSARGTAAQWKDASVLSVDCPERDRCHVKVKLDSLLSGVPVRARQISTVLDETWLLEGGQWWYHEKI